VRRFTPQAAKLLSLTQAELGRPIRELAGFSLVDLQPLILGVIEAVTSKEQEVQDREGHWWSLRVHPYRTADDRIDGAVLSWIDIDTLKRSIQELERTQQLLEGARHWSEALVWRPCRNH
jgi:two-component system CheB/CheR fusion protein